MSFPTRFRMYWWLLLFILVSFYLIQRYPSLTIGQTNSSDTLVIIVWFALALVPLFNEINVYGLSLKQEIKDLKKDVQVQLEGIRTDIRNSIDVQNQTQVNPQFLINPPPDAQLPLLEERIRSILEGTMRAYGIRSTVEDRDGLQVSDDVKYLFAARYNLEKEIRRIARDRMAISADRRGRPVFQLVQQLVTAQVIQPQVASAIHEVYRVCSPAVHGDNVEITEAQVSFVRNVAPELVATLNAIA